MICDLKIKFRQDFKSFKNQTEYVFSGLLNILSGVNGAGKSQLLESIKSPVTDVFINDIKISKKHILKYSFRDNISLPDFGTYNIDLVNQYSNCIINVYRQFLSLADRYLSTKSINPDGYEAILGIAPGITLEEYCVDKMEMLPSITIKNVGSHISKPISSNTVLEILKNITKKFPDEYLKLSEEEVLKSIPNNLIFKLTGDDIESITRVFSEAARLRAMEQIECSKTEKIFDNDVWLKTAPWTEINNLFEKLNFNYRFLPDYTFNFAGLVEIPKLYAWDNNTLDTKRERSINDLSDGEKAILKLVIATYDRKNDNVTKILLLDEYDATLNPSLVKKFYITLKDYYLDKGIIVLLTTHSAATISLAPAEANYYEIFRQNDVSPKMIPVERNQYSELKVANEEFYEKLVNQTERIKELEEERNVLSSNKILFVEDRYINIYKLGWLKLHDINPTIDNIDDEFYKHARFSIYSKGNKDNLKGFLANPYMDEWNGKRVVGLFDFDDAYCCFKTLTKSNTDEQLKWEEIYGDEKIGLYSRRRKYNNVSVLMLPVPEYRQDIASSDQSTNRLEVELLFKDEDIAEMYGTSDYSKEKIIGNIEIPKIKNKEDFWKKAITLPREKFEGFVPLFNAVNSLLDIDDSVEIDDKEGENNE